MEGNEFENEELLDEQLDNNIDNSNQVHGGTPGSSPSFVNGAMRAANAANDIRNGGNKSAPKPGSRSVGRGSVPPRSSNDMGSPKQPSSLDKNKKPTGNKSTSGNKALDNKRKSAPTGPKNTGTNIGGKGAKGGLAKTLSRKIPYLGQALMAKDALDMVKNKRNERKAQKENPNDDEPTTGRIKGIIQKLFPLIMALLVLFIIFFAVLAVSSSLYAKMAPIYNIISWLNGENREISDIAPPDSNMGKFYEKLEKYNEKSSCSGGLNMKLLLATLNYDDSLETVYDDESTTTYDDENEEEVDEDSEDISDDQLKEGKKRLKGLVKAMEKGNCSNPNSAYEDYLREEYIPKYLSAYYTEGENEDAQIQRIIDDIYGQVGAYEYWFEDDGCKTEGGGVCSFTVNGQTVKSPMVELIPCNAKSKNAEVMMTLDFETYVKGVVYAEVGDGAPVEAQKAQAIAARSFALTRQNAMCPGHPNSCFVGYQPETNTIRMRACENDQVYCDFENGCTRNGSGSVVTYTQGTPGWKSGMSGDKLAEFNKNLDEVAGMVAIDSSGEIVYTNYVDKDQNQWDSVANDGGTYYDALVSDYGDIDVTSNCTASEGGSLGLSGSTHLPLDEIDVLSEYGKREIHPVTGEKNVQHDGVDLRASEGTDVYAIANGEVTIAKSSSTAGNYIELCHDTNNDGSCDLYTRYLHLSSMAVSEGDTVNGGQVIGKSGNTGRSKGPHLHFEHRDANGNAVDPKPLLNELGAGTSDLADSSASNETTIAGTGDSISSSVAAGRAAEDIYYNQHDYQQPYCEGMTSYYDSAHNPAATIETSGCSVTSIAIAAATLNNNPSITPDQVASWVCENTSYRVEGSGTQSTLYSDSAMQSQFGIKVTPIDKSQGSSAIMEQVKEALNSNKMIIASLKDTRLNYHKIQYHGASDPGNDVFGTEGGHYVVLSSINENGEFKVLDPASDARTGYHSESVILNNYVGKINSGIWIIEGTNAVAGDSCSAGNYSVAGDYANWIQSDPRWGSDRLGSSGTIGGIGCAATSVAMQIARSGTKIDYNKLGSNEFNPGTFVAWMNKNGGFDGNAIIWQVPYTGGLTPNFEFGGRFDLASPTCSSVASKYSELIKQGYYIVSCARTEGDCHHWVAIDKIEGDTIYTFDPGSTQFNTLNGAYNSDCGGAIAYRLYKKND